MNINNTTFKSSLLNNIEQNKRKNTAPASIHQKQETDSFQKGKLNEEKKGLFEKILGGIIAFGALVVAAVKRKNIGKFIQKLFNKTPKEIKPDVNNTSEKATEKIVETAKKIEIPKPVFTQGVTAEKLAEEKKAYIDSIWDEYVYIQTPFKKLNKEKNLQGLKMLNEYGTVEDLRRLPDEYSSMRNDELYREYAKFVTKVGTEFNDFHSLESRFSIRNDIYSEKTIEEITKGIKKIRVDILGEGAYDGANWTQYAEFKYFADKYKDNKVIKENLDAIIKRMTDDNPWMIDEINKM